MLMAGAGLTVYSYAQAAANPGGGRYFVMTGLVGVGLFSSIRGVAWYARAGKLNRTGHGA
jgi:hypothetical protein